MTHSGPKHSLVLRRAVIRAQPDFYSWPEAEQLAYRMHMPAGERFVLERSAFHDLYGVDCPSEVALQIVDNFNPKVAKLKKKRRVLVHKDAFR